MTKSLNTIIEKEYQSLPNYQAKVELTAVLDVQTAAFDKAKTEVHALEVWRRVGWATSIKIPMRRSCKRR